MAADPILSNMLPLALRQHTTLDAAALALPIGAIDADNEQPSTPKIKRRNPSHFDFGASYTQSTQAQLTSSHVSNHASLQLDTHTISTQSVHISHCYTSMTHVAPDLWLSQHTGVGTASPLLVAVAHVASWLAPHLTGIQALIYGTSATQAGETQLSWLSGGLIRLQQAMHTHGLSIGQCAMASSSGYGLSGCRSTHYGLSMQPPCYWRVYPAPVRPPNIQPRPCLVYAPTRIPIEFKRARQVVNADLLACPFSCRTDATHIPLLNTYMIVNHISSFCDNQPLTVLSAQIKADMDGYCWQGSISIPPESFRQLNLDNRNDIPLIHLIINGIEFVFMAESYSDNRAFISHSYTVTGRSITAQLGGDYANTAKGVVSSDLNARQIADSQLLHTGFTVADWSITDWLVPKGIYALTDKTPMDVIQDIATAAGAFVVSDYAARKISIKPRWKTPAWAIETAAADVVVPDTVIWSISGQKQVQPQCNAVFIYPDTTNSLAYDVARIGSDKEPRAALRSHTLYTAESVCRAAGMAALSATGTHKIETVKLPLSPDKYGLNLAQLGEIWRFDEPLGAWAGVITGVSLEVSIDGDTPMVSQTLTVDRYLDIIS